MNAEASKKLQNQNLRDMDKVVKYEKTKSQFDDIAQKKESIERDDNVLLRNNDKHLEKLEVEAIENSKKRGSGFLYLPQAFQGCLPLCPGSAVYAGGFTGQGKSTVACNISTAFLESDKKVLYLSNEESGAEILQNIACIHSGINYRAGNYNSDKYTIARAGFNHLKHNLTIIGPEDGLTSSCDGIAKCLNHYAQDFDLIIIDWYQNITEDRERPFAQHWEPQQRFSKFLKDFKNRTSACIIVFGQLNKGSKKNGFDLKSRMIGKKDILDITPVHIELKPTPEEYKTSWYFHKSRHGSLNMDLHKVETGFDNGRLVEIDEAFKEKVLEWKRLKEEKSYKLFKESTKKTKGLL